TLGVTTRSGAIVNVCRLRLSTCEAHEDYSRKSCESHGTGDHSLCGLPGHDDAYCVNAGGALGWICTVPCNNGNYVDCPAGSGSSEDACTNGGFTLNVCKP